MSHMTLMDSAEHIRRIAEYMWADECQDYAYQRQAGAIEPNDPNHIFTHIVALSNWADSTTKTAEDHAYETHAWIMSDIEEE